MCVQVLACCAVESIQQDVQYQFLLGECTLGTLSVPQQVTEVREHEVAVFAAVVERVEVEQQAVEALGEHHDASPSPKAVLSSTFFCRASRSACASRSSSACSTRRP